MENRLYYTSHFIHPDYQDDIADNSDIINRNYIQYKCDTITEHIGNKENSQHIDLFLDEINIDLDWDALKQFYYNCLNKLIEVYHLPGLDPYAEDKRLINYHTSAMNTLLFFEKNYMDLLIPFLEVIDNPEIIRDPIKTTKYLLFRFPILRKHIKEVIKNKRDKGFDIPIMVSYFFLNGQKTDIIFCLMKLVNKDVSRTINELILIKGGLEQ